MSVDALIEQNNKQARLYMQAYSKSLVIDFIKWNTKRTDAEAEELFDLFKKQRMEEMNLELNKITKK